jgi:serine/threonine protein kinase/WD40 repeat protein
MKSVLRGGHQNKLGSKFLALSSLKSRVFSMKNIAKHEIMSLLNRELEIFNSALEQTTQAERAAYLKGACGEDAGLRARIETLLHAHDDAGGFLPVEDSKPPAPAKTIVMTPDMFPVTEKAGDTIGRYKLREKIGEGGCGVVYVADQEQPVRRRVALKVIKLGMDTKSVIARFEAERQALAMMDHPNIAKVLDAGATEAGRPYFVMELVRGIKITDYCDQNKLSTTERLDLFIKVCQAVQHAHQKGIIHRDLKPSNVLVTLHDGVPVPKIIDFGISKATEGRLTDLTVYTELNQFIGTPAYMSPEQAEMSGLDIDTRSDIYSLGVLLYELLTGGTPFDAQELVKSGLDAMRKTIREKEPVRPSTRLNTMIDSDLTAVAHRHGAEPPKLVHLIKGDLDWIVMKSLEKDRTRRYETANGLAADIRRHLGNEPIIARPPSSLYRFQKMARRNRFAFAASVAVATALLLGILVSTWQALRATRAKHEALAAQSQAVAAQAGESIQRQKAEANQQQAVAAQANEAKLREQAEAEELAARQRAYVSDINLVQQSLANNNLGRAVNLLNRQRPGPGQKDLRGWEWRYLWQQCRSEASFTLCQKTNEIDHLAASADGRWLAEWEQDQPVLCVWDLHTRQVIARLPTGKNPAFDFSKHEPLLAYSEETGPATNGQHHVIFWNPATRQKTGEIQIPDYAGTICFAADGLTLGIITSTGDDKHSVSIWRVSDHKQLSSIEDVHFTQLDGTAFSPNLGLFAHGGGEDVKDLLHVLDLATGRECWSAEAVTLGVTALAFSPDGKILASGEGFAASPVNLWDVTSGKKLGMAEGHSGWVSALVFEPDGKTLASTGGDETIRLWDVSDATTPHPKRILHGHKGQVLSLSLLADGITLFSGSKDGEICCWDISSAPTPFSHWILSERTTSWDYNSDGSSLWGWVQKPGQPGQYMEWTGSNFQTTDAQWNIPANLPNAYMFTAQLMGGITTNVTFKFWNRTNQQILHEFALESTNSNMIGFLASSQSLLTLNNDNGLLSAYEINAGKRRSISRVDLKKLAESYAPYLSFLSPNDQWAIFPQGRDQLLLVNIQTGQSTLVSHNIRKPGTEYQTGAFSPDGKFFALCSYEGYVKIWEVGSWREVGILRGWTQVPHSVVFSPDGRLLAVGSDGIEAVRLFDAESYEELLTFSAEGSLFNNLTFSPDSNVLGASNTSGNLNLWRAPSWIEIAAAEKANKP